MSPDENLSINDQHARAIGYLSIAWTELEQMIDRLVCALVGIDSKVIQDCVVHNSDMRQKIQMSLSLGFVRKPTDAWYQELSERLKFIDEKLRPQRNRMIHDEWFVSPEEIIKRQKKTYLVRLKTRNMSLLTFRDEFVTVDGIAEVTEKINHQITEILSLWLAYAYATDRDSLGEIEDELAKEFESKLSGVVVASL